MIRRPPRSTQGVSSAASDVYKRQYQRRVHGDGKIREFSISKSQITRSVEKFIGNVSEILLPLSQIQHTIQLTALSSNKAELKNIVKKNMEETLPKESTSATLDQVMSTVEKTLAQFDIEISNYQSLIKDLFVEKDCFKEGKIERENVVEIVEILISKNALSDVSKSLFFSH
eukprot:TRINITY_DN6710_c0_g1_i2.p1 TRINITY_DN6710_c0_g1~~TRINITY_DN6710_c0_g1_i2.p1  ORF type:complete len:172 (-),score=37.84 TRINITY_DN6710_c0_g1_i2:161-676(-)